MAREPIKVYIPFQQMLEQITDHLHFPKPTYEMVAISNNNAYVAIQIGPGRGRFLLFGGEAATSEHSRERAARKAIHKLKSRFSLRVADYTSDRIKKYELCGKLIRQKCSHLIRDSTATLNPSLQSNLGQKPSQGPPHDSLDWVHFLNIVAANTDAFLSPVETVWIQDHGYVGWVTVNCGDRGCDLECIFSAAYSDASAAAQQTAKKAVFYLVTQYNLEIVDVNYGSAAGLDIECARVTGAYFAFRSNLAKKEATSKSTAQTSAQRKAPLRSNVHNKTNLQLPSPNIKRRRSRFPSTREKSSTTNVSTPLVTGLPELETVVKLTKHA